ncbi:MAG: GH36 C-terminal domain-containing protein, partial [Clostridia bacterium]|nr:GH36 C-terminal domain-containing protein [Clostridia bacterium]
AVKTQIAAYKRIEPLVLNGDLYRLSNPFGENYFCNMLVSKDKTQAYVVGEQLRAEPNGYYKESYLRLTGLAEEKKYLIEELDITSSGAVFINFGVQLPHLPDYGSFVWHIGEVK